MLQLIICGSGNEECLSFEKNLHKALLSLSMEGHVSHLEIEEAVEQFGLLRTPALIINSEVVLEGQPTSQEDLESFLMSYVSSPTMLVEDMKE